MKVLNPMFSRQGRIPKIEFVSTVDGLADNQTILPQPAKNFIPQWWKNMPATLHENSEVMPSVKTAKICPSFPDYFGMGYVIPMWADTTLKYDEEKDTWEWRCGTSGGPFSVDVHPHSQFLNYVSPNYLGQKPTLVFKFNCPWRALVPKGYALLQLPMFYSFNPDFVVLPGVIQTDIHSELNQQVLYFGSGKEVFIKRGTPLVQYVPIPHSKLSLVTRHVTNDDRKQFARETTHLASFFQGSYRNRRKDWN